MNGKEEIMSMEPSKIFDLHLNLKKNEIEIYRYDEHELIGCKCGLYVVPSLCIYKFIFSYWTYVLRTYFGCSSTTTS